MRPANSHSLPVSSAFPLVPPDRHRAVTVPSLRVTVGLAEALFGVWGEAHHPGARARGVLASALLSDAPRPECAPELALFGQFVGSWDLEVVNYSDDGSVQTETGEWHFAWALGGRAIVDVWISPARDQRSHRPDAGDYGATVRFFDPELGAIRSTWLGPLRHAVRPFIARAVGDDIVLSGTFEPSLETRWTFSAITADRFHWRSEQSADHWGTARLRQEFWAQRRED